jgi:EAL domain-containing protein (putative c-di-GMP-specific phosphodiesterase class I)
MGLTRSVDTDLSSRALVSAMAVFASETRSQVVAEGVETDAEWQTLHKLGIEFGQGFFLGRPADVESAIALLQGDRQTAID